MERIRSRADQMRGLADTAKAVRMGLADRRHSLDIQDKEIFQKCLDSLQTSISVRSAGGMSERLETIARQLNLKLITHAQNQSVQQFYISSENFYIEITMDKTGTVKSAVINHQNPEEEGATVLVHHSPQIVDCLNSGAFDTFVKHVEGLVSVYSLNCTPVEKSRAWQALWSVESDLLSLSQPALAWVSDIQQLIHKTPLGMVEERAGGLPMKLRIFLSPFELLDVKEKKLLPLTQETVLAKDLGLTVTVGIRSSEEQYLTPFTAVISNTGQEVPFGPTNSLLLPAHLALELGRPLPLSSALSGRIAALTEIPWLDRGEDAPLLSLIARLESKGSLDPTNNRGLFVTLPDQQHCYFMTETPELTGQVVTYIPFRHPAQVPTIVDLLRRQALFNALVASCVRVNSLEDVDTSIMFEMTCLDPLCASISLTFEYPGEEGMATVELVLSDLLAPSVQLFLPSLASSSNSSCLEADIGRVLQRSLSLPITMRSLIRRCQKPEHTIKQDTELLHAGLASDGQQPNLDGESKSYASGGRFKTEPGRGSAPGTPSVCDPGGPGGGRVKQEAMDTTPATDSDSLNRFGPQDVEECLPGARITARNQQKGQFRRPVQTSHNPIDTGETRRKSDSIIKLEPEEGGASPHQPSLSLAVAKFSSSLGSADLKGGRPSSSKGGQPPPRSSSCKEETMLPFVSITPIGKGDAQEPARDQRTESSGIEIIPLGGHGGGGGGGGPQLKAKVRDLKRSYSEDDKRRMERKEKRRREEMKHRASVSPTKRENDSGSVRPKDPKAKLAGVIERLAFQTGDSVGIEIRPANSSTAMEIDPKARSSPGLKVTIKNSSSSDRSAPGVTIQNFADAKEAAGRITSSSFKPGHSGSNHGSGSSSKSAHKINERFITDPGAAQRSEERKRSADSNGGGVTAARRKLEDERRSSGDSPSVSLHLVKSPSHMPSPLRQVSPAHQLSEAGGGLESGGGEGLLLGN